MNILKALLALFFPERKETLKVVELDEEVWERPPQTLNIDYTQYIASAEWRGCSARLETLAKDNNSCRMCGRTARIAVHHITYQNLGNEDPAELVTLCSLCHTATHALAGRGAGAYPPINYKEYHA